MTPSAETVDRTGTYLLPMAYPEGSPAHPYYPAGHATIAGACTTVLEAFFKESFAGFSLTRFDGTTVVVGGRCTAPVAGIARASLCLPGTIGDAPSTA